MIEYDLDGSQAAVSRARMEQRTTPEAKTLIERAARLLGLSSSDFVVAAACRAARDTLRQYETTVVIPEAHRAFMDALDDDRPSAALVDLMRLHDEVALRR